MQQNDHYEFKVVVPGRSPSFFMIVTGSEGSSLWAYTGSHEFVYYPAVVKKTLTSTLYTKEVIITLLSLFVGHGYFGKGPGVEWVSETRV